MPCPYCGEPIMLDDVFIVVDGEAWHASCAKEGAYQCDNCGRYTHKVSTVDGYLDWCDDCVNSYATRCDHCHELVSSTETVGSEDWCDDCVEKHATRCERCGDPVNEETDSMFDVQTDSGVERWCDDCTYTYSLTCVECGSDVADDSGYEGDYIDSCGNRVNDGVICPNCLENFVECGECGILVHEDAAHIDDWGDTYCPECAPNNIIHEYHHTYADAFYNVECDPTPKLYMGIELETETPKRYEMAEKLLDHIGSDVIECKDDSSLTDGCEIVTQPCTPSYHLQSGIWREIASTCLAYDATSHDNGDCGLHIHVSRDFFSNGSIHAALVIDALFERFEREVTAFTRRGEVELRTYARYSWVSPIMNKEATYTEKIAEYNACKRCTRYEAVNLCNADTIELRLYRGTLKLNTIYATIEFTAALALLADAISIVPEFVDTLTWEDFKKELFAALAVYLLPFAALDTYFGERGL